MIIKFNIRIKKIFDFYKNLYYNVFMENINVIKKFEKNSIFYQYFCSHCHYWILRSNAGINFCPNCGKPIKWENAIEKQNHKEWMQFSKEKYEELKD